MIKIAIDAMGGDFAPEIVCNGINDYLKLDGKQDIHINLFGVEEEIKKYLNPTNQVTIIDTPDFIKMDEKDAISKVRTDKTSSLYLALRSVKLGESDGFVGAGPTGPVVAYSQLIVKRIEGIRKVALTAIGTTGINPHPYCILDVGANIDVSPINLVQYAISGSIYAKEILNINNPKVALICNGVEKGKGRELEREVYDLLTECPEVNFVGYMEPSEIFSHEYDVIVSDGFTQNAVMKTAEGTLKSFGKAFKGVIKSKFKNKIAYLLLKNDLKPIFDTFGQKDVGAAILLGINAPVLKAHGNSNADKFMKSIIQLENVIRNNVVEKIKESVKND